jgi:hypothetical protein
MGHELGSVYSLQKDGHNAVHEGFDNMFDHVKYIGPMKANTDKMVWTLIEMKTQLLKPLLENSNKFLEGFIGGSISKADSNSKVESKFFKAGLTKGSIYTHDTHAETWQEKTYGLLEKIFGVNKSADKRDRKRYRREIEDSRDAKSRGGYKLKAGGFGAGMGMGMGPGGDGGDDIFDMIGRNPVKSAVIGGGLWKGLPALKKWFTNAKSGSKKGKLGLLVFGLFEALNIAGFFEKDQFDENGEQVEGYEEGENNALGTGLSYATTGLGVWQAGKWVASKVAPAASSTATAKAATAKGGLWGMAKLKKVLKRYEIIAKRMGGWKNLSVVVGKRLGARVALAMGATLFPEIVSSVIGIGLLLWWINDLVNLADTLEKELDQGANFASVSGIETTTLGQMKGRLDEVGSIPISENSYSKNYSGTSIAGMPVGNKLTKTQYEMMKLSKSMGNTHSGGLNDKFNAFKLSEDEMKRLETPDVGLSTDAMKALKHADDGPNNSLGVNIHNWDDSPFGGTRSSILEAVEKTGLWGWVKDGIKTDVNAGFDGLGENPTKAQVEALWKGKSENLSKFGGETESSIKSIYASEFKKFFGTVLGGIGSVLWGSNAMAGDVPYDPAGRGHGYGNDPDGKGFWDKGTGKKTPKSKEERDKSNKAKDDFRDKWNKDHPNDKLDWPDAYQPEPGQGDLFDNAKMNQANQFAAQMVNLSTRYSPKGQMFPLTMMNHGTNSAAGIKANGFQSKFANAGWAGKNKFYGSPSLNVAGAYGGQNIQVVANAGSRRIFGGGIGANGLQFGDEIAMGARGMNQGMDLASRLSNHPNSAMAQRLLKTGTTSQASKLLKLGGRAFPGVGAGLAAWDAKARFDKGDTLGATLSAGSGIPIAGLIPLAVQLVTDYLGITGSDKSSSVMDNYVPTRNLNPANSGGNVNGGGGNTIINNTTNTSNNSSTDVLYSTTAHAPALPYGMVGYGI